MTNDKRQTTNDKRQTTNDKRQTTNDKRQTTNDKRDWRSGWTVTALVIGLAACTTPNPIYRGDAGVDAPAGGAPCSVVGPLRCAGGQLVSCNGTAEVIESCALGCNSNPLRCFDVGASNGLSNFLDEASKHPNVNLGDEATIDTNSGVVTIGAAPVAVKNELLPQSGAPNIRVFIVGSLTANKVTVTGTNALAIVSNGDIQIDGTFNASAKKGILGPGAFNDGSCRGANRMTLSSACCLALEGSGGGGFGSPGGRGGAASSPAGSLYGAAGGATTGNALLVPLRGGCGGGIGDGGGGGGGGGGAIQLVSRSKIAIGGIVAANGGSDVSGGSGGGILLEAPIVDVSGRVVANGAAGGDASGGAACTEGEEGHFDATFAHGGMGCVAFGYTVGSGGNGGALHSEATAGGSIDIGSNQGHALGGSGGGGVGRIRINTAGGTGLRGTGIFSPNPTQGTLAAR